MKTGVCIDLLRSRHHYSRSQRLVREETAWSLAGGTLQFISKVARLKHSFFCNDSSDQFCGGHVECWVPAGNSWNFNVDI